MLVGYIEKLMDDTGWATAHIAGNSLGGISDRSDDALRYLCHRPNVVSADLAALAFQALTHCQQIREFVRTLPFDAGIGDLENISVPITVLFAEQDMVMPPRHYGQRFVTEHPAIRTRTMPDVGHIPMLEAPDLVATEIRSSIAFAADRGAD